ncbi:MAG TPA: sulfocyanin-like copper-binding protein [Longimicrobiales bacterium]|nr:sulfocyanin-like copper-binding protein [Longimicrobiales bacterium]
MMRLPALTLVVALAACGGGEPAQEAATAVAAGAAAATAAAPAMGEMTMTDWFHADDAAKTIHMTITAGLTDAKNHWNFNGGYDGNMTITVPEGYAVTIDLVNKDPAMAHSLGISAVTSNFGIVEPVAAFEGAITSAPASMTDSTLPGETETITFTAGSAGSYSMVCFVPGHAAAGMWIRFNVSADGTKGVQTAM